MFLKCKGYCKFSLYSFNRIIFLNSISKVCSLEYGVCLSLISKSVIWVWLASQVGGFISHVGLHLLSVHMSWANLVVPTYHLNERNKKFEKEICSYHFLNNQCNFTNHQALKKTPRKITVWYLKINWAEQFFKLLLYLLRPLYFMFHCQNILCFAPKN